MNISTFIGLLSSLVVFLVALVTSTSNLKIFLDVHAILIVLGGTVSASLVCFSLPKIVALLRVFFRRLLGRNKNDYAKLIGDISNLSQAYRKGSTNFEAAIKTCTDPFLKDAAEVLFWLESDVSHDKLRAILETRAKTHYQRYQAEADIFKTMSKFPPAFGLMGTTLGMIALLQSLGGPDAKNAIGPAMSIALVATLYGIVLANLVFIPISENLMQQTKDDMISRSMVVEGIMNIAANEPTKFVEEAVKSYLLPSEKAGIKKSSKETATRSKEAA